MGADRVTICGPNGLTVSNRSDQASQHGLKAQQRHGKANGRTARCGALGAPPLPHKGGWVNSSCVVSWCQQRGQGLCSARPAQPALLRCCLRSARPAPPARSARAVPSGSRCRPGPASSRRGLQSAPMLCSSLHGY